MKKIKTLSLILVAVLTLGGILYSLADRYLIERVIIDNVPAVSIPPADLTQSTATAASQAKVGSNKSMAYDDWNYERDGVSIHIEQVTAGSGSSQVVYYVADVKIADATLLSNAFAKNQFGKNIIQYTSQIAQNNDAIFAINGDYYGFRSDGIIIRNGVIYRNVPARTGLAFYRDGSMRIYDETKTTAEQLVADGVWNTLSFGPALVENSEVVVTQSKVMIDTNMGNHSIQGDNPRTGVGIIENNHFVFVVVDGRSKGYSVGVDLTEFANIFKKLGCITAYNLDGGGSSTMYFMGRTVNNPLGAEKERGTSDILFIK